MNAFEKHGVEAVSASTINGWTSQPAKTLLKIAGIKSNASPAMWRGTAAEHAMNTYAVKGGEMAELVTEAEQRFDELHRKEGIEVNEAKLAKERKALQEYVASGVDYLRDFMGDAIEPPLMQGKCLFKVDELPVPIVGYYDMLFKSPHQVVDIKTVGQRQSQPSYQHSRQVSVYWAATGAEPWIWYVGKKGVMSFVIDQPKKYFNQFIAAAKSLEAVLNHSDDIFECCQLVYPDIDHWMWCDDTRAAAKDIWKMED